MLSTTPPQTYDTCPEYPGGKSWDEVPGQTGSGQKFHRNVISGADFTADVRHVPRELDVMVREWESLNAKAELARMHREGHCHEAMVWYVHHTEIGGSLVSPGLALASHAGRAKRATTQRPITQRGRLGTRAGNPKRQRP